jgi:ribokinase
MRLSDVSIVVVGSSNTDMIVTSARIPRPGETVLGGGFAMAAGGKGANQAVGAAVALAAKKRVPVILNPAPARRLERALLERVSILSPNESEAALLAGVPVDGEASAARAARLLRGRGVETVIITLGARGAFVAGPGFTGLVPGFKVKVVDTTAAGDIFNGALAVAIGEGKALPDAVRFGHAAAALSVTRRGAQPSAPRRADIDRFLRERA